MILWQLGAPGINSKSCISQAMAASKTTEGGRKLKQERINGIGKTLLPFPRATSFFAYKTKPRPNQTTQVAKQYLLKISP